MHALIQNYINADSHLRLFIDDYGERPDITAKAVYLEGNIPGFLSLMGIICLYINELEDDLLISELSFVTNEIGKQFRIIFSYGEQLVPTSNGIVAELENEITWALTETEASVIATELHGFGYAWNHLHLDPNSNESKYAIYCYLKE